jgi:hypothetical protein
LICRKLHGAVFVTFAAVKRNMFDWSAGEGGLRTFYSSDTIDRSFCGKCGSQLVVFCKPEPNLVYVTMGTVNGNPTCPSAYHQFIGSKAPWHEITDGQSEHDTWPEKNG